MKRQHHRPCVTDTAQRNGIQFSPRGRSPALRGLVSPVSQDLLNATHDPLARSLAVDTLRQQFVVSCVVVTNWGHNGGGEGLLFEIPLSDCPANTTATLQGGMFGDRS